MSHVISGCQTGVDQAALFAAEEAGLKTGGHMPKNYRTDEGRRPDLAKRFGLMQTTSWSYRERTYLNVVSSEATIGLAYDLSSPGMRLTEKYLRNIAKPYQFFDLSKQHPLRIAGLIIGWLRHNNFRVINVAGNRESSFPGIHEYARPILTEVFRA